MKNVEMQLIGFINSNLINHHITQHPVACAIYTLNVHCVCLDGYYVL